MCFVTWERCEGQLYVLASGGNDRSFYDIMTILHHVEQKEIG